MAGEDETKKKKQPTEHPMELENIFYATQEEIKMDYFPSALCFQSFFIDAVLSFKPQPRDH